MRGAKQIKSGNSQIYYVDVGQKFSNSLVVTEL